MTIGYHDYSSNPFPSPTPSQCCKKRFQKKHIILQISTTRRLMENLVLLVGEDLLTTLAADHTVLLLLTELGRRKLDLLLGGLDLVAHGVKLLLLFLASLQKDVWLLEDGTGKSQ